MSKKRSFSRFIALFITVCMLVMVGVPVAYASPPPAPVCTVRPIGTPVAGQFPASLWKYPYKANLYNNTSTNASVGNGFAQTITWEPAIETAFLPNTEYTVTLLLEPNAGWSTCGMPGGTAASARSFSAQGITPDQIAGLPTDGVKALTYEYAGTYVSGTTTNVNANLIIHITFEATGPVAEYPDVIFYEDFSKGVHADNTIGEGYFMFAQQANRQGLGNWRDNMTSVRVREDGGSELVLAYSRVGTTNNDRYVANNWITAGGVRTRGRTTAQGGGKYGSDDIIYENAFGYYEAAVKFPQANVVWGAFWLFSPATAAPLNKADGGSIYATEIDIIESPGYLTKFFNAAYHVYRSSWDRSNTPSRTGGRMAASEEVPIFSGYEESGVDIYDGEFHKIGLEWSPTDYKFYVDGVLIGSWKDLDSHYFDEGVDYNDWSIIRQNEGVMQNPAYIKLTVEAATWADESWDDEWAEDPANPWRDGRLGIFPNYGEMVVDYVYVLNGPKPPEVSINGPVSIRNGPGATAEYIISATDMPLVSGVELEFELDGNYLGAHDVELFDMDIVGNGNYGSPIYWRNDGDTWFGKVTLFNADGISGNADLIKLIFGAKPEILGITNVKLSYTLMSYAGNSIPLSIVKPVATTEFKQFYVKYDVNEDGVVDLNDITFALKYFKLKRGEPGWDEAKICDVDDSGEIDLDDLILILANYTDPYYK